MKNKLIPALLHLNNIGAVESKGKGKTFVAVLAVLVVLIHTSAAWTQREGEPMKVSSPAFEHQGLIPAKYTCQGADINPPLNIENIPPEAKSLALIVDDPDAPVGTWVHWIVFDIPVIPLIEEDTVPGKQGSNDFGKNDWGGPCPPSGTHRYFFKMYALDTVLNLKEGITKETLEAQMESHILAKAELIGLYQKN